MKPTTRLLACAALVLLFTSQVAPARAASAARFAGAAPAAALAAARFAAVSTVDVAAPASQDAPTAGNPFPVVIPLNLDAKGVQSVAAADFDNDGDDDYLMGNLGENHRFNVSDAYPLQMYAIDLDNNGSLEPLFTAYWKDDKGKMTEYPVNYFDELAGQTKFFQKLFKNYKEYSYANIHDMLDAATLKRLEFKLSINTTSSYIVWNDKGTFRFEKMPPSMQVSPITRMLVRDLNGDGIPDAVVGGNDYSFDIASGYYDANKGFVLLSKGPKQAFDVRPPSKSGLLLKGMIQSLQFVEGDTLMVVAGVNRDRILVYKQTSK